MAQASAQAAGVQRQVSGVSKQMAAVSAAGKIIDRTLIGVGLGAGAMMVEGVKGAANLQSATLQSATAMGRLGTTLDETMGKMQDFRAVALDMSNMTGQSLSKSMQVISLMAQSGLSAPDIKQDYAQIAQFGDILHWGKDKMSYEDSAKIGAGLIHEFNLWSAKDTAYGLGELGQLGFLSPHGTAELATQMRLGGQQLERILPGDNRKKAYDIMTLTAWADRMGGLQRFGAGIQQLTTQLISPRSKRVKEALSDLGVYDIAENRLKPQYWDQKTGTLQLIPLLKAVAEHYTKAINMPGGRGQAVMDLLGLPANAARNFQLFSNPQALLALANVERQHAAMGDPVDWMRQYQTQLMDTLDAATGRLITSFQSLATLIASPLIEPLTKFINHLNDMVSAANKWLNVHPKEAGAIGIAALTAAGYAGLRLLMMFGGLIHLFEKIPGTSIVAGFRAHIPGMGGGAAAGGGIASAIGGLLLFPALRREFGAIGRGMLGVFTNPLFVSMFKSTNVLQFGKALAWLDLKWFTLRLGLAVVGEAIGKIALRFIPFVGEAMLVFDALNFLGSHMKDIGYYIGTAVEWMTLNLPGMFMSVAKLGMRLMGDMLMEIVNVLNPANIIKATQALLKGYAEGAAREKLREENAANAAAVAKAKRLTGLTNSQIIGVKKLGILPSIFPKVPTPNTSPFGLDLPPPTNLGGPNTYWTHNKPPVTVPPKALPSPSKIYLPPVLTDWFAKNISFKPPQTTNNSTVTVNVTVTGGKTPQETGNIVGQRVVAQMRNHGMIVSRAIGTNQGGAAHASGH